MRHTKWCSHPVLRQVVMGYTSPSSLPGESRLGRGARGGCGPDPMSAQRPHPAFAVPPGPQENQLVFAAGSPYEAGRQAERFVSILAYYAVYLLAYSAVLKLAYCVVLSLAYSALMIGRRRYPPPLRPGHPRGTAGGRFPDACIERPGCREPANSLGRSRDLRAQRARRQEHPGGGRRRTRERTFPDD